MHPDTSSNLVFSISWTFWRFSLKLNANSTTADNQVRKVNAAGHECGTVAESKKTKINYIIHVKYEKEWKNVLRVFKCFAICPGYFIVVAIVITLAMLSCFAFIKPSPIYWDPRNWKCVPKLFYPSRVDTEIEIVCSFKRKKKTYHHNIKVFWSGHPSELLNISRKVRII